MRAGVFSSFRFCVVFLDTFDIPDAERRARPIAPFGLIAIPSAAARITFLGAWLRSRTSSILFLLILMNHSSVLLLISASIYSSIVASVGFFTTMIIPNIYSTMKQTRASERARRRRRRRIETARCLPFIVGTCFASLTYSEFAYRMSDPFPGEDTR